MKSLPMLLLLPVLLCCSKQATPPTGTTTGKPFAQRLPGVKGVENFARINVGLYRGAEPTDEGFKHLKAMGVKTVVDFRTWHPSGDRCKAAGLCPVEIPLQADAFGSAPPDEKAIKLFFETVLDPKQQPVYIHCAFGKDRTGMMAALYRLEVDGWTADEVLQEMQAFGYHDIYVDLVKFVKAYKPRGFVKK